MKIFWGLYYLEQGKKCQKEKRKTINGDDLLWAMATLGFEDYIRLLKVYLHIHNGNRSFGFAWSLLYE